MKIGVFNSIQKPNDKALNSAERILPCRRKSGCKKSHFKKTLNILSMMPELSTQSLFLKASQ